MSLTAFIGGQHVSTLLSTGFCKRLNMMRLCATNHCRIVATLIQRSYIRAVTKTPPPNKPHLLFFKILPYTLNRQSWRVAKPQCDDSQRASILNADLQTCDDSVNILVMSTFPATFTVLPKAKTNFVLSLQEEHFVSCCEQL